VSHHPHPDPHCCPSYPRLTLAVRSTVPSFAGWDTFPRACVNLLTLALAIAAATWAVHQTEYAIEYGGRFSRIMAPGSEHAYMTPLGLALMGLAVTLIVILLVVLMMAQATRLRLAHSLPWRVACRFTTPWPRIPPLVLAATAAILAAAQLGAYLFQENAESLLGTGTLPGLAVLVAPRHLTVIPLHLLAAICCTGLLWTLSLWLRRERHTLQVVRLFAALTCRAGGFPPRLAPRRRLVASRRSRVGDLGLRSPPVWC
jgi:hypothetical protein